MKRPSFQFYPGDWLRDTALRSCSLPARGAWMDMLCLMHEGYPYGFLKVGTKVILPDNLARMIGATLPETEGYLRELEDAGVFSRDGSGCIYSRRMVKDEELRCKRANGGHLGGNPNLVRGDENTDKDNPKVGVKVNLKVGSEDNQIPTPSSSSSTSSSPTKDTASPSAPLLLEVQNQPKTRVAFKRPEIQEVIEFAKSLQSEEQAEPFTLYYESVGWTVGKGGKPMKDWKSAFKGWLLRNRQGAFGTSQKPQGAPSTPQIQAVPITDPDDLRLKFNLPNHCPFIWNHWLGQDPECNLVREYKKETTPPERKKEIMDQAIWCWKRNGDKIKNYWGQYTL